MIHKIKILFFLFGGCGGAERMTLNIAKSLPSDKYSVKFVVCGTSKNIYPFIPTNYDIISIPWHNIYCFPKIRMANVISKEKPDFVFSSSMGLNVRLLEISKWFGIKCIVRSDNMLCYVNSPRMVKRIEKTYKSAYRVIAQQEEMQAELIDLVGSDSHHIVCLHNPIDTETIKRKLLDETPYPNDDSINYLWVGNYQVTKGHDVLVDAFKIVHEQNPKSHLYFVGNIDVAQLNYHKVKQMVKDYNLVDYVHFMGQQENPYNWMKYCDCFVLPSRLEGLPNVLIEAQYIGRPCVATECIPMIKRIIDNGVNGYTVPVEDPESMAIAMQKAINMGEVKMTYKSATQSDFVKLFR